MADETSGPQLEIWRCRNCNRLLGKHFLGPGSTLQSKCGKCNFLSRIEISAEGHRTECCRPGRLGD